jgi:alpha-galactosidase
MTARREPLAVVDGHGERSRFALGAHRLGSLEITTAVRDEAGGCRLDWVLRNPRPHAVTVERIGVEFRAVPGRVVEHGWQSWSPVRRCRRDDTRPVRRHVPRWRSAMLMADPAALATAVSGDQFLLDESGITGFLSAEHHFGTVHVGSETNTAWALLDGVTIGPGEERRLDPLWWGSGDAGALYSTFAELWARQSRARPAVPAPSGWCSWYRHFGGVSPDDVRRAAAQCRRHGLSVVQIDDGYQAAVGDWGLPSPRWSGELAALAREIASAGLRAGIWTAPFLVGRGSRTLADRADLVLRDQRGRPIGAMHHPLLWGGWAYALDTTHPATLDHLRAVFSLLVEEGFTYHKLDFLYAAALAGRHHDGGATRAQALRRGLEAVRHAVGESAYLLACGCPFGPAVGVVDAMRVSPDVSRHWQERSTTPGFAESQSGLRNAIRATVLRAPLHRRLWANDPDCVLLEPDLEGLSDHHSRLQRDVVAATGGFTMLSDRLERYGEEQWQIVKSLMAAAVDDGPLDLFNPFGAPEVRSRTGGLRVDWRGRGQTTTGGSPASHGKARPT